MNLFIKEKSFVVSYIFVNDQNQTIYGSMVITVTRTTPFTKLLVDYNYVKSDIKKTTGAKEVLIIAVSEVFYEHKANNV